MVVDATRTLIEIAKASETAKQEEEGVSMDKIDPEIEGLEGIEDLTESQLDSETEKV